MRNLNLIDVKILDKTKCRPQRIKITSDGYHQSIILPMPPHKDAGRAATEHLESLGFTLIGYGTTRESHYFMSTTFKPFRRWSK